MDTEEVYADDFVDDDEVKRKNPGSIEDDNGARNITKPSQDTVSSTAVPPSTSETAPHLAAQRDDEASMIDRMEVMEQIQEKEVSASEGLRLQRTTSQNEQEEGDDKSYKDDFLLSGRLVKEGEKNIHLALEIRRLKDESLQLQKQMEKFRAALLNGINEGMDESQKYNNVSLVDLLRIRLQVQSQRDNEASNTSSSNPPAKPLSVANHALPPKEPSYKSTSDEATALRERNNELQRKCTELTRKMDGYKECEQKNNELKQKISRLMDRTRNEKEKRDKVKDDVTLANRKIEALSEHIEKLMAHLKFEVASKSKAVSELGRVNRELDLCKKQNNILEKKNNSKDRVITELQEAGKILQDQLRLMDDKYMELRLKLDWSRTQTERLLKGKDDELRELQTKLALANQHQSGGVSGKQRAFTSSHNQDTTQNPQNCQTPF
jgi:chromosome segregation ATPase